MTEVCELAESPRQSGRRLNAVFPAGPLRSRIVHAAKWSALGAAFLRGSNLVVWVFCARFLGKVGFGELSIVMSTAGALGILAGMGLGVTVTRYTAEFRNADPQRAGRVLGLSLATAVISSTVISCLLIGLAPVGARVLMNPHLTSPLRIAAVLVWLQALSGYQSGALAGLEAFRSLVRVNLWAGTASIPIIVLFTRSSGLTGAICGLAAAQGLACVLNHIALRRECTAGQLRCSLAGCRRELPLLWRCALPALLSSTMLLPAMWICSAFLARQSGGYAQLGIYAAADRWRLVILFAPACVFGTVLPMLSNLRGAGDRSGFQMVFRANILVCLLLALLPAVAVAAMAKPLMSAFGGGYTAGWPTLAVLALGATFEALNTALGQTVVTESMWRRFGFDALLVSTLLCMAWVLIPRMGAFGLSVAYGIAFMVVTAGLLLYTHGRVFVPVRNEGASVCLEG